MYEIKLSDGTKIKDLGLNGNNYISQIKIEDSLFDGKLSHVEITDKETGEVTIINDAVLIQNKQYGDEWWFILAEKSQDTKQNEIDIDLNGKVDYLAMMLDIEFMGV